MQGVGQTAGAADATRQIDAGTEILFYLNDSRQLVSAIGLGSGNAVAKDIKLAQKMIEAGVPVDAAYLRDPNINLKKLLRPATAA